MGIYRGAGGSGDAVNDSSSEALITIQARDAALAAQAAAEAAQAGAIQAEANAEIAEANAETAEANAEAAEANVAASASAAASSASNASSSASSASTSASNAATSASNAAASASAASTSASNALSSATNAAASAVAASTSAANAESSATAAQTAQAAAEAALDQFDDTYLGAKASNPTVDNDGNPLTTGDQYFNTVANELRIWNGSSWQSASTVGGTVTSLTVTGAFAANGSTVIGDASGDSVTINASTVSTPNGISFNGTSIPASKTLVVTTDIGSTVQAYDADLAAFALKTAPTGAVVGTSDTQTLTNKTIALGSNTVSGTLAQFNTAVTDADLVSIAGSETLTNKTLTSPTINTATISGGTINNAAIGGTTANTGAFTTLSASGVATFSAGTVSAPAITTTGDTNTGIFFPAADTIAFTEGGVEAMRIDSSGNVGIGASPSVRFDVLASGSGDVARFGVPASSRIINFYRDSANFAVTDASGVAGNGMYGITSSNVVAFLTNSSERMRITSNGDVGIGVSSPEGKLHVRGSSSQFLLNYLGSNSYLDSDTIIFRGYASGSYPERMRIDSSGNVMIGTTSTLNSAAGRGSLSINGSSDSILAFGNAGSVSGYLYSYSTGLELTTVGSRNLVFQTSNTERMRITSGGNIGIGTSAPSAKLDVRYTSFTPSSNIGSVLVEESTAWSQGIQFYINNAGTFASSRPSGALGAANSFSLYLTGGSIITNDPDGGNAYTASATAASAYRVGSGIHYWFTNTGLTAGNTFTATERMRIDPSGNLLVGTKTNNASGGVIQVSNGITFPATQSASTDANTLDDYEEGTWTPTITFGGGSTGITYFGRSGSYVKVGRLITCQGRIDMSNKGSSTGTANLGGLPFACDGGSIGAGSVGFQSAIAPSDKQVMLTLDPNSTSMNIRYASGTGTAQSTNSDFTNSSILIFSITYLTN